MNLQKSTLLGFFTSSLAIASASRGTGHTTVRVCNRGLCYNRKEDWSRARLNKKLNGQNSNDCSSGTDDCEIYSILGADIVEEIEAVECLNCENQSKQESNYKIEYEYVFNEEELEEIDLDKRRSWKEEPKRGSCYSSELGYLFDCNLIQILDDGLVLIEDLRSGGSFAAEPSTFHLHKNEKKKQTTHLPPVVVPDDDDPIQDFRTIVELNMMGI